MSETDPARKSLAAPEPGAIFFLGKREPALSIPPLRLRGLLLLFVVGAFAYYFTAIATMEINPTALGYGLQRWRADESIAAFTIVWVFAEPILFVLGALLAGMQASLWRRTRRMEEVALTLLSPVTIAQIMLRPCFHAVSRFLSAIVIGVTLALFFWAYAKDFPGLLWALFPFSFIVFNVSLTAKMAAWAQLTFSLSFGKNKTHWAMFSMFTTYMLTTIPFYFVFGIALSLTSQKTMMMNLGIMAIPLTAALFVLKYLFASSCADRLETAVFPFIEHS